jgi:hypothetical protein
MRHGRYDVALAVRQQAPSRLTSCVYHHIAKRERKAGAHAAPAASKSPRQTPRRTQSVGRGVFLVTYKLHIKVTFILLHPLITCKRM